jgi:dTDP-L-rhamnose 4-epimerase
LRRTLAERFDTVVVVDAFLEQVHGSGVDPRGDEYGPVYRGRVEDPDQYDWLDHHRPDVVVHLAAETGTAQSMSQSALHVAANSLGTAVLLDALLTKDVIPTQFVVASSRAVYGEGGYVDANGALRYPGIRGKQQLDAGQWDFSGLASVPMRADRIDARPASVYGATKLNQEHLLGAWSRAYGAELSVLRLQNVYGAGQAPNNPYTGILPLFFNVARAGGAIPVYEDGNIVRDFVHVNDVVRAFTTAIENQRGGTWDIGAGVRTTIAYVADLIAGRTGAPPPKITGQYRVGDVRSAVADITSAQRELEWSPTVSLREGLEELDRWLLDAAPVGKPA